MRVLLLVRRNVTASKYRNMLRKAFPHAPHSNSSTPLSDEVMDAGLRDMTTPESLSAVAMGKAGEQSGQARARVELVGWALYRKVLDKERIEALCPQAQAYVYKVSKAMAKNITSVLPGLATVETSERDMAQKNAEEIYAMSIEIGNLKANQAKLTKSMVSAHKRISKEKAEREVAIAKEKAEREAAVAKEEAAREAAVQKEKAEREAAVAKEEAAPEVAIAKEKAERGAEIGMLWARVLRDEQRRMEEKQATREQLEMLVERVRLSALYPADALPRPWLRAALVHSPNRLRSSTRQPPALTHSSPDHYPLVARRFSRWTGPRVRSASTSWRCARRRSRRAALPRSRRSRRAALLRSLRSRRAALPRRLRTSSASSARSAPTRRRCSSSSLSSSRSTRRALAPSAASWIEGLCPQSSPSR